MATVVVIGAGVGGLSAAIAVPKRLAEKHQVVVVERESVQWFQPSLLRVLTGRRTPRAITRSIQAIKGRGITLVKDDVHDIDMARRTVKGRRE